MSTRKSHDPIWLRAHGFDGLCEPHESCGCGVDDFAPCNDGPGPGCVPARRGDDDDLFYAVPRWRGAIRRVKLGERA